MTTTLQKDTDEVSFALGKDIPPNYSAPISTQELTQLTSMISETYDISVVQGATTSIDVANKTIIYNSTLVKTLPRYKTIAHIVSAAASLVHSYPRHIDDKGKLVADFIDQIADVSAKYTQNDQEYSSEHITYAKSYLPHKSALGFYERAEHSRSIVNMRREMPGLRHSFLPDPGEGFLKPSYDYTVGMVREFLKAVPRDTLSIEEFWDGMSLASAMYAEGLITYDEIAEAIDVAPELREQLDAWVQARSANEALDHLVSVMDSIAKTVYLPDAESAGNMPSDQQQEGEPSDQEMESEASITSDSNSEGRAKPGKPKGPSKEPQEEPQKEPKDEQEKQESKADSQAGEGSPKGEGNDSPSRPDEKPPDPSAKDKTEKTSKPSAPKPPDSKPPKLAIEPKYTSFKTPPGKSAALGGKPSTEIYQNLKRELANTFTTRKETGYSYGYGYSDENTSAPDWYSVRATAAYMIQPMVAQLQRRLKDNHEADMDRGFRSGPKIEGRAYIRGTMNANPNYFKRTSTQGEKKYAAYLMFDISGSMCSHNSSLKSFYGTFGSLDISIAAQQARMAVAFIESLKRFPEIWVGVGAYNGAMYPLKSARDRIMTPALEKKIISTICSPGGDNRDEAALRLAIDDVVKVPSENKLVILFTDGGLCCTREAFQTEWLRGVDKGVSTHMIVTGSDSIPKSHWAPWAPSGYKQNVHAATEANIGQVIGHICQDWIKVR